MTRNGDITVIIPTIGDEQRAGTIWRAIESAGARSGVAGRIVVVVNGTRYSPALVAALKAHGGIECLQIGEGSLPQALRAGMQRVDSEFFTFLDDDDEILEDGLRIRAEALQAAPEAGFVVTRGWRTAGGADLPQVGLTTAEIEADPLGAMMRENWLVSCAGLYRSAAVTAEDFAAVPQYLEWTYLGLHLASRLKFRFIDAPTYRVYEHAGSVSRSRVYHDGMIPALQAILALRLPAAIQRALRRKLGAAHHTCSTAELADGRRTAAWRHHLHSLLLPGGLRYVTYTRHLLRVSPARSVA